MPGFVSKSFAKSLFYTCIPVNLSLQLDHRMWGRESGSNYRVPPISAQGSKVTGS